MSAPQTHPATVGTLAGVPVVADLKIQGGWDLVYVTHSADYVAAALPGYPNRPPAGQAHKFMGPLGTVNNGTRRQLFRHEAAALVAAGAAVYS